MTITARHLMRRAYGALKSGDLAERNNLKDAMGWINFQNSVPNRQKIADFFRRLDSDALTGLPSNPARLGTTDEKDYCQGTCSTKVSRFHWVDIVSKQTATSLPRKASQKNQSLFRSELIRWAEDRISVKKGPILWLAELDEQHFQDIQPFGLLGDLGRYKQVLKQDDRVAIYTVEIESVHKPTMIDAGFAFFWLAWQDDDSYGMTLGLNNGQPTYKEWVAPKDSVKVVDAWFLISGEGSLVDEQLPIAYWDSCRQRVLARRSFLGGSA